MSPAANEESPLEKEVKNKKSEGFIRKAAKLVFLGAAAAATTALVAGTMGTTGLVISGAFAGGGLIGSTVSGKSLYEITKKALKDYNVINTILNPIIALGDWTYPIVAGWGAKAATAIGLKPLIGSIVAKSTYAFTAYNAAFVGGYKALDHLYENFLNPKGIVPAIRENFTEEWARTAKVFAPGFLLTANNIITLPIAGYAAPVFALNAPFANYINTVYPPIPGAKQEKQKAPAPAPGGMVPLPEH